MSATYDTNLGTDRDYVRFLTGDVDCPDRARVTDETIDALLVRYPKTYCAAARLLAGFIARTRGGAVGGGITSKSVDGISVSYGGGAGTTAAEQLKYLREECARQGNKRAVFVVY